VLQAVTPLQTYSSVLQEPQSVYCSILRFLNCTLTSFHIFCLYILLQIPKHRKELH
jgi:hypothetical protein